MNRIAERDVRPWELPVWKPAEARGGILLYLVTIHVLGVMGLVLFPVPDARVLIMTLFWTGLGGLGTSVCYHRLLAHRALRLNIALEQVLIFCAIFNGSGAPGTWVAYHRHHHSYADTSKDISSPQHGGFWWAHLGWLYQSPPADIERWCPELNKGRYNRWEHAERPIVVLSLLCGLALGWQGFFWIGAIRLVYSLHMQCFVNSLAHLPRAGETNSARNIWWLGPLQMTAWGENWHRNHHASPGCARLGLHWWEVDIGSYFIYFLESVGLATGVKRPKGRRR